MDLFLGRRYTFMSCILKHTSCFADMRQAKQFSGFAVRVLCWQSICYE